MRAFENGADRRGKWRTAISALVDTWPLPLAPRSGHVANTAAMRTFRTIGPAQRLEMPPGGVLVIEDGICKIEGHTLLPRVGTQ